MIKMKQKQFQLKKQTKSKLELAPEQQAILEQDAFQGAVSSRGSWASESSAWEGLDFTPLCSVLSVWPWASHFLSMGLDSSPGKIIANTQLILGLNILLLFIKYLT